MDPELIIALNAVFVLQLLVILITGLIFIKQRKDVKGQIQGVSVIIPFKNEANRIEVLLSTLDVLDDSMLEVEYIFVNDHSQENEENSINKLKKPFIILQNDGKGKKAALRTGILQAKYDYILTWDADIAITENYFQKIVQLAEKDMWILPVRLTGKNLVSRLGAIDQSWLQIMGYAFGLIDKPFVASGANLLFKKDKFLHVDNERKDYNIASGDDMFLLQEFNKRNFSVAISNNAQLSVYTQSPDNFHDLVAQRSRWAKKMRHIRSFPAFLMGSLVVLINLLFVLMILLAGLTWSGSIVVPLAIKYIGEYLMLRFYKGSRDILIDLPVVFAHQVFFPFYLLSILIFNGKEERWS